MKRLLFTLLCLGAAMPFWAQTTFTALSGSFTSDGTTSDYLIKPTGASKVELTITNLGQIIDENSIIMVCDGNYFDISKLLISINYANSPNQTFTVTSTSNSIYIYRDWIAAGEEPYFSCTYKAITNQWTTNGSDIAFNNGNVGIGTLTPNFPFTIEKSKGNTNAKFGASSSVYIVNTAPAIGFNTYLENGWKFGKTTNATTGNAGLFSYNTTEGKMYYLASSAAGAENGTATMNYVMSLTKDGKMGLGIGNTSPTSRLDIKQATNTSNDGIHLSGSSNWYMFNNANGYLQLSKSGVAYTGFTFNYDATNGYYFSIGDYLTAGKTSLLLKTTNTTNGYSIIQSVKTKGTESGALALNPEGGIVLIGTTDNTLNAKLAVNGRILATEVKVMAVLGADFVFAPTYKLRPLSEVESFIKLHQHLPEIATAKEMEANGVDVSEMQTKLLQKVEELTLYVIEQGKQIEAMKKENEDLKKHITGSKKN